MRDDHDALAASQLLGGSFRRADALDAGEAYGAQQPCERRVARHDADPADARFGVVRHVRLVDQREAADHLPLEPVRAPIDDPGGVRSDLRFHDERAARECARDAQRTDGILDVIQQPQHQHDVVRAERGGIERIDVRLHRPHVVEPVRIDDQRDVRQMLGARIQRDDFPASAAGEMRREIALVAREVDRREIVPRRLRDERVERLPEHREARRMNIADACGKV